jgi:hypothetical protein
MKTIKHKTMKAQVNKITKNELQKAVKLGRDFFKKGGKAIPHQDDKIMDLIGGYDDIYARIKLLKSWHKGWMIENLREIVK